MAEDKALQNAMARLMKEMSDVETCPPPSPIENTMKQIQTVDDVYPAVEELIAELKSASHSKLAGILHHRMHLVAWTARSELFEELQSVLMKALQSEGAKLSEPLRNQMQQTARVIDSYLKDSRCGHGVRIQHQTRAAGQ